MLGCLIVVCTRVFIECVRVFNCCVTRVFVLGCLLGVTGCLLCAGVRVFVGCVLTSHSSSYFLWPGSSRCLPRLGKV